MRDSPAHRFIGGSPLTVLVRLVVVSVVAGALMSWLGIDAVDILVEAQRGFERLYGTGFAALRGIAGTALTGAAVVVPVWVVLRVMSWRGPRARPTLDDPRHEGRVDAVPPRWTNPDRRG